MKKLNFKPLAAAILMALGSTTVFAADSLEKDLSDANKEGRIWSSFALNRQLNAFDLSVDVDGEIAVLTGTVEAPIDRELAEQVALNVSGVKTIENRIKVDPRWTAAPRKNDERTIAEFAEDATITANVKSKLLWNETTNALMIDVDTLNRRVTLNGSVDSEESRVLSVRLATGTSGVRSVDDQLTIMKSATRISQSPEADSMETNLSDAWITAKIESSFAISKYVDALDINVNTQDGVVSLSGTTASRSEKDLAIELADSVRGTRRVDGSGLSILK